MCMFITLFLPACSTDSLNVLTAIAARHHCRLDPLENASVAAWLKPGEQYFYTTENECDCGTTLGCLATHEPPSVGADYYQRQINKLRAKGWSKAKIARRQQEQAKSAEKQYATFDPHCNDDWYTLLDEILASKRVGYVGLLLHFYSGRLSGRIPKLSRQAETISLHQAGVECLAHLRQDVLYEFH